MTIPINSDIEVQPGSVLSAAAGGTIQANAVQGSGNSGTPATADPSLTTAPANNILTADGSGNVQDSGVPVGGSGHPGGISGQVQINVSGTFAGQDAGGGYMSFGTDTTDGFLAIDDSGNNFIEAGASVPGLQIWSTAAEGIKLRLAGGAFLSLFGNTFNLDSSGPAGLQTNGDSSGVVVEGSLELTGKLYDGIDSQGSAGQILSSTGTATAWANIGSLLAVTINAQTGTSYAISDGDRSKLITFSNTAATAVTLPQAGASSQFLSGWYCYVENLGTGLVTITPTTSTINGWPQIVLGQYQSAIIFSDGTNYETHFVKIASTDAASAISSYVENDAGIGASQNQIVMQDIGASNTNTKRKGLNIYLETAAQAAASNYDGLQVNVGATITTNTSASAGHVEAAEFYVLANRTSGSVTLTQINGVKIRTSVAASTAVENVVGLLFYLPEWTGTITSYAGISQDAPTGGGTITNLVGVQAGSNYNSVTITNATALTAVMTDSTITNSYGVVAQAKSGSIIADDTTVAGSFIGHANVAGNNYPTALHDGWYGGTGSPEGVVTANVGSMFSRQDSTIGDSFYLKAAGSSNTEWAPVGTIVPIKTVTTTYAATNSDGTINCIGTFTVTLASSGVPTGKIFNIKNIGTGSITVSSAVNIDFALTQSLPTQGQSLTVQWDGTQWWIY